MSNLSNSIHIQEIKIRIQATAICNRAIAADSHAIRIYIRATATRRGEIGIYSQEIASKIREIASEWWPCASTSQEMAVNIEEIEGYARRSAAAAVETTADSRVSSGKHQGVTRLLCKSSPVGAVVGAVGRAKCEC